MTSGGANTLAAVDWNAITRRQPFTIDWPAVRERVAGRTVLVTGAAGSLGAPLSTALAEAEPARLVLYDHHEGSLFHLREALASKPVGVRALLGDVRSARRLTRILDEERPDLIFHLAAYKHVPWGEEDPAAFVDANVIGAAALIGAAQNAGTSQIVYPSTDKAIDPPSLYGATKRLVELMLHAAAARGGPRCTVVRFVNVLGSRGSAPETFARQLAEGKPLSVTDEAMRRYWITPDHARLLLLHAACVGERAITVTPDAGDEISVLEIARRLAVALLPDRPAPEIAVTGLRPGERLSEPITVAHETLERLPLEGLLAVRGTRVASPDEVDGLVARLSRLLDEGADQNTLREALFQGIRALQSPP